MIALGERGDLSAAPVLRAVLGDDAVFAQVPRACAAVALGQLGDTEALPALVRLVAGRRGDPRAGGRAVKDDDPARGFAALALGLYARPAATDQGPIDRPGFETAITLLLDRLADRDETVEVRSACAVAVGLTGRTAYVQQLARVTADLKLPDDAIELGHVLLARAMLGDRGIGHDVTALLGARPPRDETANLLARRAAVLSLGLTGSREFVPQLVEAWNEPYFVNREVIYAIGLHGAVGIADTLVDRLKASDNRYERAYMAESLGEMLMPSRPSRLARTLIGRNFTMKDGLLEDERTLANVFLYRYLIPQFESNWY